MILSKSLFPIEVYTHFQLLLPISYLWMEVIHKGKETVGGMLCIGNQIILSWCIWIANCLSAFYAKVKAIMEGLVKLLQLNPLGIFVVFFIQIVVLKDLQTDDPTFSIVILLEFCLETTLKLNVSFWKLGRRALIVAHRLAHFDLTHGTSYV